MPANELHRVGEFAPQHRLGPAIVGVAIRMPAGEIVARIVVSGIEAVRLRTAEAAGRALQNVAAVLGIERAVLRRARAGRAWQLHRAPTFSFGEWFPLRRSLLTQPIGPVLLEEFLRDRAVDQLDAVDGLGHPEVHAQARDRIGLRGGEAGLLLQEFDRSRAPRSSSPC